MAARVSHDARTPAASRPARRGPAGRLRRSLADPLHRSSLLLVANTAVLAVFGATFWILGARTYPAADVGVLAAITSLTGLLGTVAALGLPNTLIRYLATSASPRRLTRTFVLAAGGLGSLLTAAVVAAAGPFLPSAVGFPTDAAHIAVLIVLVTIATVSAVLDAALIALKEELPILVKSAIGGAAKLALLAPCTALGGVGLPVAYGVGALVPAVLAVIVLGRRAPRDREAAGGRALLRRYASFSTRNYLATVIGVMPTTVVPLLVLAHRGATETAYFAAAFMLAGLVNVVPSNTAQALLAEVSRSPGSHRAQLTKAFRAVYGVLVPVVLVGFLLAPLVLALYGDGYAAAADTLRLLLLSGVFVGATYLIDAILLGTDRVQAYLVVNVLNTVLVLGLVGVLVVHGLTAGAVGWVVAQAVSALAGAAVLASGRVRRRSRSRPDAPTVEAVR